MMMLDSAYRDRWQEYHLSDGLVMDSRVINWRRVEWEKVVKIVVNICGKRLHVDRQHSNFLFFMCFRWAGQEWANGVQKKISIWTIGWSDGERCFLVDIDVKTGEIKKKYISKLSEFSAHIHPRIGRSKLKGISS